MEHARVCRNTKGTRTQGAAPNVCLAQTARETGLASETSAPTPVLGRVVRGPLATL